MKALPNLTFGFGFTPRDSEHHFLVTLEKNSDHALISEHLHWDPDGIAPPSIGPGREDARLRVMLDRHRWDQLADPVRVEFNRRLKSTGQPPGQWKGDRIPMARSLGKELVLLAWSVEQADPMLIQTAVQNWLGLQPEERWWMYTMTCAATGHAVEGRGKGWRKAVRYALTENPTGRILPTTEGEPEAFELSGEPAPAVSRRGRASKSRKEAM